MCLYVDDFLFIGGSKQKINEFKKNMISEFEMADLGRLSYFLGMEFVTSKGGIFLHQSKYAMEVLKRFKMLDYNHASTPTEAESKIVKESDGESVDATLYK